MEVGELLARMQKLMPPERPGSLPAQTYIDIIAFMLQKNAFPAGDMELSADRLRLQILITATRPGVAVRGYRLWAWRSVGSSCVGVLDNMCWMGLPIFKASVAIALTLSASLTMSMAHAEVAALSSEQEQTARLRVGDTVQLDGSGAALTFKAVQRDSRCPKDVRCIRAGEAVVVLELRDRSR